ncbi:MAG: efflux RND transporter permease subunit [Gammaproteobacteria bacterium]
MAHPHPLYGGDLYSPVVEAVARAYGEAGYTTLRFNFRGVGGSQGEYAQGIGEQQDIQAALSLLKGQRAAVTTLRSLQVPIAGGRTVPLSQFAAFEYGEESPLVWRRDRVPTLTVCADVVAGVLPDDVVAALEAPVAEIAKTLPKG